MTTLDHSPFSEGTPHLLLVAFPNLKDTRPRPVELPWPGVVQRLTTHEEREQKDGAGWSPAIYKAGYARGVEGVEALTGLTFDIDHDEPPWELIEPYEYVAYTTFSHRIDDPHWRVFFPLAAPVPAEAWADFWERARHHLCPNADESCRDTSRFFYKPACRPGADREAVHHQGAFLHPADVPELPPAPTAERTTDAEPVGHNAGGRPGDDFNRRGDWRQILEPHGAQWLYERGDEAYIVRPGKRARNGQSATVNYKGSDLLYVFTSEWHPFEPHTSYTKFAAYALLNHQGDFAEATRALAAKGYGEPASGAAAKNVTPSAQERRIDGPQGASNLGSGPVAPKNVTKSVTHAADTLRGKDHPLDAAEWPAFGCRLGSAVVPENVHWLWSERIALAKLCMVEGNGGEGKSLILDDLAARLTANLPMPDGTPNPFGEPVKVLLLMAEDDAADTIIPRIMAAGGNPANVVLLDNVPDEHGGHFPTIPDDLDHIERVLDLADARLLVIDPLVSYLSEDVNSHNDHSVRRALATVPGIAARRNCAIVAVRHLNKNTGADPKHRGSGAGAFINLARIGLAIGPDPDDDSGERRILAVNKVNVGEQASSLAYHVETAWVRKSADDATEIKTARVIWDGPSTLTAADILGARPDEETRTASEIARDLLSQLLTDEPQDEESVWATVKKAGVSRSSYMRARKSLGVKASRAGGLGDSGRWQLSLPPKMSRTADILSAAEEADTLSKNTPFPDRSTPARVTKSVSETSDTLSERLSLVGRSAAAPDLCEQPGCVRRPSAVDRGRWVCFSHHPLGSAAATTNGSAA